MIRYPAAVVTGLAAAWITGRHFPVSVLVALFLAGLLLGAWHLFDVATTDTGTHTEARIAELQAKISTAEWLAIPAEPGELAPFPGDQPEPPVHCVCWWGGMNPCCICGSDDDQTPCSLDSGVTSVLPTPAPGLDPLPCFDVPDMHIEFSAPADPEAVSRMIAEFKEAGKRMPFVLPEPDDCPRCRGDLGPCTCRSFCKAIACLGGQPDVPMERIDLPPLARAGVWEPQMLGVITRAQLRELRPPADAPWQPAADDTSHDMPAIPAALPDAVAVRLGAESVDDAMRQIGFR